MTSEQEINDILNALLNTIIEKQEQVMKNAIIGRSNRYSAMNSFVDDNDILDKMRPQEAYEFSNSVMSNSIEELYNIVKDIILSYNIFKIIKLANVTRYYSKNYPTRQISFDRSQVGETHAESGNLLQIFVQYAPKINVRNNIYSIYEFLELEKIDIDDFKLKIQKLILSGV
jgi:hypothetical protein